MLDSPVTFIRLLSLALASFASQSQQTTTIYFHNKVCNADCTVLSVCPVTRASFAGGRPLCRQILPGQGRSPPTILGVRKLETLGYQVAKTASLCIPSFWHNTAVWRTDRQTDLW